MTRQEANREILEHLILAVESHPHLRFGQIIQMLGAIKYEVGTATPIWRNEFYVEPMEVLERIESRKKNERE